MTREDMVCSVRTADFKGLTSGRTNTFEVPSLKDSSLTTCAATKPASTLTT